jgi:hypothetical protein
MDGVGYGYGTFGLWQAMVIMVRRAFSRDMAASLEVHGLLLAARLNDRRTTQLQPKLRPSSHAATSPSSVHFPGPSTVPH